MQSRGTKPDFSTETLRAGRSGGPTERGRGGNRTVLSGRAEPRRVAALAAASAGDAASGRKQGSFAREPAAAASSKTGTVRRVSDEFGEIAYTLFRKPVKNLNLRMQPNGEAVVSVPQAATLAEADGFVLRHADWIRRAQAELRKDGAFHALEPALSDGLRFPYLGTEVCLTLQSGAAGWAFVPPEGAEAGRLLLTLPDPADGSAARALFFAWRKAQCEALFFPILEKFCRETGRRERPTLQIRTTKGRWGSCTKATARIRLNACLLHVPVECVEYVAAHEAAHLIEANHSPAFYRVLSALLPDWQARRAQLKEMKVL